MGVRWRSGSIALVCVAVLLTLSAAETFVPASYRALKLGIATIADVRARLGPPNTTARGEDGGIYFYYDDRGPFAGKVEVIADATTSKVYSIVLYPKQLLLAEAQRVLGSRFERLSYS